MQNKIYLILIFKSALCFGHLTVGDCVNAQTETKARCVDGHFDEVKGNEHYFTVTLGSEMKKNGDYIKNYGRGSIDLGPLISYSMEETLNSRNEFFEELYAMAMSYKNVTHSLTFAPYFGTWEHSFTHFVHKQDFGVEMEVSFSFLRLKKEFAHHEFSHSETSAMFGLISESSTHEVDIEFSSLSAIVFYQFHISGDDTQIIKNASAQFPRVCYGDSLDQCLNEIRSKFISLGQSLSKTPSLLQSHIKAFNQ